MALLIPRREKEENDDSHHSTLVTSVEDTTSASMPSPTPSLPVDPFSNFNKFSTFPPGAWSLGPWTTLTRSSPEATQSTTSSYDHSPVSDNVGYSSTPTLVVTSEPPQSTSTNSDDSKVIDPSQKGKDYSGHGGLYAAAGIIPVAVLAILGVAVFFYLRKRKRQRQQAAAARTQEQEMKTTPQSTVQPYLAASSIQPSYTSPPSHPPPPASQTTPQPVILGPIAPTSNGAYYTGIDTSDIVSVNGGRPENDRTGLGNPFADTNSLHEEPPPPYRPRSFASSALSRDASVRTGVSPLSRNTSLRGTVAHSQTNLIDRQGRSPFADPDEDAASVLSSPATRRHQDTLSVVSDLSYQEEPTTSRPPV